MIQQSPASSVRSPVQQAALGTLFDRLAQIGRAVRRTEEPGREAQQITEATTTVAPATTNDEA